MITIGMTDYDKQVAESIYNLILQKPFRPITSTLETDFWIAANRVCDSLDDVIDPIKNEIEEYINEFTKECSFDSLDSYIRKSIIDFLDQFNRLMPNLRTTCKWKDDANLHHTMPILAKHKLIHELKELVKTRISENLCENYF